MNIQRACATLVSLTTLVVAAGCSDAPTDDPPADASTATVQGKIEAGIAADAVIATQLVGQERRVVSTGAAELSDDGSYALPIEVADPAAGPIVISAQAEGEVSGSVLVTLAHALGETVAAPPIDVESSVEAEVYGSAYVDAAPLKLLVDEHTAMAIDASQQYAADLQATANGVLAASLAFEQALAAQAEADVSAELSSAHQGAMNALIALDGALHDAQSDADVSAALEVYADAYFAAYADAGFDHEALCTAALAAVDGVAHYAAGQSAEVRAAAWAQSNALFAELVSAAIAAELAAAGASQATLEALAQAEAQLDAEIAAAAGAGAEAQADIAAAWADYAAAAEAQLSQALSLTSELLDAVALTLAETEASLDATLTGAQGDAAAVAEAIGDAHADYRAEATADTSALVAAGLTEAHAGATLSILATTSIIDG